MKNRVSRFVLPALLGCVLGALPSLSLAAPGDVTAFNATLYNPPFQGSVQVADMLPFRNGKVLVGGRFQTVNGVSSPFLTLLNADGTKAAASWASVNNYVVGMLEQPDGRVIIYGWFTTVGGVSKPRIARLFPDGSLDVAYSPPVINGNTYRASLQADGKLLVYGDFTSVGGATHYGIFRLNADGSLDTSLTSPFTSVANVYAAAVQADGKIILGSKDTNVAGSGHDYIARLNADGSVDTTFDADATTDGSVHALAIQADGDILVGGDFNTIGGVSQGALARLNSDGSLDTGFAPAFTFSTFSSFFGGVASIQLQTDGKILLGGHFTAVNSAPMEGVALLNANGTNATFNNPAVSLSSGNSFVVVAELTSSGSILVGGRFATVDGATREGLAELENGVASQSLSLPLDTEAEWLRSGAEQEIPGVEFSVSEDGSQTWTSLGAGTRISGGWEKTGLTLPASGYLRARMSGPLSLTQGYEEEMMAFSSLTAGTLDAGFNPNANNEVHATAEQPDGKLIAAGAFTTVGGAGHVRLVRFNANGSIDTSFTASASWPPSGVPFVVSLVVQPDGKILLGGDFIQVNGISHVRLARLNEDGSLDSSFTPSVNNGVVNAIALQPDGKIVIGGDFTQVTGTARTRLARLNADGSLDTGFTATANDMVRSVILQPDGKVLVSGLFTQINGTSKSRIARLDSTGTLDTGFTASANNTPLALVLQPDGKIVMGGTFTTVNGTTSTRLARVDSTGALDTGFTATASLTSGSAIVYGLTLQTDGKILVSGLLNRLNGTAVGYCGRLNGDGTLDSGFNAGANTSVYTSTVRKDGRIAIGGDFTSVQSTARNRIAQLDNDLIYQKLSVVNTGRIEWIRSGASPEASRVTFELSTDGGSTWSSLGSGTRISGGWELTGLSLTSGKIRARAFTPGGKLGASAGLIETVVDF